MFSLCLIQFDYFCVDGLVVGSTNNLPPILLPKERTIVSGSMVKIHFENKNLHHIQYSSWYNTKLVFPTGAEGYDFETSCRRDGRSWKDAPSSATAMAQPRRNPESP